IEFVGEIADAEGDPGLVNAWKYPLRHVDEGIGIRNRIRIHDDEIVVEIEAVADVAHRGADLERPCRGKTIRSAGVGDKARYVRGRVARIGAGNSVVVSKIESDIARVDKGHIAPEIPSGVRVDRP